MGKAAADDEGEVGAEVATVAEARGVAETAVEEEGERRHGGKK